MVSDNEFVWDPNQLDESSGFTREPPPEEFITDGAIYTITAAQMGANRFGDKGLELELEDADGDAIQFFIKYSKSASSKWGAWIKSLASVGVTVGDPSDLEGISFVAKKTTETGDFKDRNDPTKMVKRDVTTVTIAALADGPASGSNGHSPEASEELIQKLLDVADGQPFARIMSIVSRDDAYASIRKAVVDKTLLASLVDEGRLEMNGKTYVKVG